LNPAISPAIDRTLCKSLSLSPSDRFATIDDFLLALEGKLVVAETIRTSREPLTVVHRVPEKPTRTNPPAPVPAPPGGRRILPRALVGGAGAFVFVVAAVIGLGLILRNGGPSVLPLASPTAGGTAASIASLTLAGMETALPLGPTSTLTNPPASLTPFPSPTLHSTPTGGAQLLAFVSNRSADKHFQIYTYTLETREIRQLTFDPTDKGRLVWSSDGQFIYFEGKANGGSWDIFCMNADGSNVKNLTNNPADDLHPAVSRQGNLIAFASGRISGYTHVYTMSVDGSNVIDISAQHKNKPFNMPDEWDPAWSPDGHYLYFVLSVVGPVRIYRWDTQLSDSDPVIVNMFDGDYFEAEPAVSPAGNLLAYTRQFKNGSDICIADTDLSKRRPCDQPLTDRSWNSAPAWSSDGLWLAFMSRRSGNGEIYLTTVSGAGLTNLTNNSADDRYPAWQPAIQPP
jgi:TolB protein